GREALDGIAALVRAGRPPDVVLMDLLMPGMDGVTATAAITQRHPEVDVVAMTSFTRADLVHGALQAGAAGYLLKDAEADEVTAAIRPACRGEVHLDPAAAAPAPMPAPDRRRGAGPTARRTSPWPKRPGPAAAPRGSTGNCFLTSWSWTCCCRRRRTEWASFGRYDGWAARSSRSAASASWVPRPWRQVRTRSWRSMVATWTTCSA